MKSLKSIMMLVLVVFLTCGFLNANPVVHPFQAWGIGTGVDRVNLYFGWTNGFFQARGQRGLELMDCLERKMTTTQAIAMIDKRYKDHPELWSHFLGEQILEALTAEGSPCEDKNPLTSAP